MRSPGVLCAAGLVAAALAGAAGAVGQASPRLTLILPQPVHVTLAEVGFRLPDVEGKRLRLRVPFALPSSDTLPDGAKVLSAIRVRRGTGSTVYTILLAAVNAMAPPAETTGVATALPPPIDSGFLAGAAGVLYFGNGGAAPPAEPIETLFAAQEPSGFHAVSSPVSYVDSVTGKRYHASAVEVIDVDEGTSVERAVALNQLGLLGNPLNVLNGSRVTVAQYDNAHLSGWKVGANTTKRAARDAWGLLGAAPEDVAAGVQKLEAELGIVVTPPPPPTQLYRFSIGGFGFSFDTPPRGNPPSPTHVFISVAGATACGLDPVSADWTAPYTVTAGGTSSGTVTANFAEANPFQIYLFLDYLPPGSPAAPNGEVIASFGPVPDDPVDMRLTVQSTGAVANLSVSPSASVLPITRTPVASC